MKPAQSKSSISNIGLDMKANVAYGQVTYTTTDSNNAALYETMYEYTNN